MSHAPERAHVVVVFERVEHQLGEGESPHELGLGAGFRREGDDDELSLHPVADRLGREEIGQRWARRWQRNGCRQRDSSGWRGGAAREHGGDGEHRANPEQDPPRAHSFAAVSASRMLWMGLRSPRSCLKDFSRK